MLTGFLTQLALLAQMSGFVQTQAVHSIHSRSHEIPNRRLSWRRRAHRDHIPLGGDISLVARPAQHIGKEVREPGRLRTIHRRVKRKGCLGLNEGDHVQHKYCPRGDTQDPRRPLRVSGCERPGRRLGADDKQPNGSRRVGIQKRDSKR